MAPGTVACVFDLKQPPRLVEPTTVEAAGATSRRWLAGGEFQRGEYLVGVGQEGGELGCRQQEVVDVEDDCLSSNVQDDEAEDLARSFDPDAVRKVGGVVCGGAEWDEEVLRADELAVELKARESGELDAGRGLVGGSVPPRSQAVDRRGD